MNYYDANAVACESAAARYTEEDLPTLCDCGAPALPGETYCEICKNNMRIALNLAVDFLEKYSAVDRETAISQLVYAIEGDFS